MHRLMNIIGLWLLLGLIVAVIASPALADGLGMTIQRVDASQFPKVRVYASAATAQGIPITGLDARSFELREDDKPVAPVQVQPIIDSQEPISSALIVDTSGSMKDEGKLDSAKAAASAFVDGLGPEDSVTVVSFATQVKVVQEFTGDKALLKRAIGTLAPLGDTVLYDAIAQTAARQAKQPQRRKVLIVLTDGEDTKSAASQQASAAAAQAANSPIFIIGLGSDVKKDVLDALAAMTGGQAIYVSDLSQLRQTFLSIGDQLRRQYVLEYTSLLAADEKPHPLRVKLSYTGQEATAQAPLLIPRLTPPRITGLSTTSPVQGPQHISVDVPAGTQRVQLLVDDQPRTIVNTAPFAFDWDATRETPGQHRIDVQVIDAQGQASTTTYIITVAAPPPTPVPTVARAPTAVATVARVVASPAAVVAIPVAPATPANDTGPNWALVAVAAGALLLVAAIAAALFFATRRPRVARTAAPIAARPPPNDDTELVGDAAALGEATYVKVATPAAPAARLRITRGGVEHEVLLDGPETTIGRDDGATIPIRDEILASRRHARIVYEAGQFWIEDTRSLNGTQVNGEVITRRKLASNDRITIGETTLTFVIETRAGDRRNMGGTR
jgi:VWFA-related protein